MLEKNITFQRININLQDKPDWFLNISPTGKVLLLKVLDSNQQENILFESVAICEYIEETYTLPNLYPLNAINRAQHRAWIEFSTATLADAWGYLNASNQQLASSKATALREKLAKFDIEISKGPFFTGEKFCMVDVAMAPVFRYFDILKFENSHPIFNGLNQIAMWRHSLAQRLSVQNAIPEDYSIKFHEHLRKVNALLGKSF